MNKGGSVRIVHVESLSPFGFEPIVRGLEAVFLVEFVVNLVEGEKLAVGLGHLVHKGSHILVGYVGTTIDRTVGNCFGIDEVVDEVCITKLAVAEAVECRELFAVVAHEFVEASGEVLVESDIDISHYCPPAP